MAGVWNDETEKALLIGMLECNEPAMSAKYEAAAVRLGASFSANGCR